jgi:uncharacterized membrane protein YfcA
MSLGLMLALTLVMVITGLLSGIFGMAGGLILMGVLLALLPLPAAMALHAVTQIASNGWRALLWRDHIQWRAASAFLAGSAVMFAGWMLWQFVPSKPVALILLGLSPFIARVIPASLRPDTSKFGNGMCYGAVCMALLLLTGVSGPLVDTYFLGGKLERRQIVATKAACQICGHMAKLLYFGGLVEQAGSVDPVMAGLAVMASIVGTTCARPILDRLSDVGFRRWANRIITAIATVYLAQGSYLLGTAWITGAN